MTWDASAPPLAHNAATSGLIIMQVDSFTMEGAGVHNPSSLKVTLQATQQGPSWHLDHIVCTVLEGGKDSTAGRKYYFMADR